VVDTSLALWREGLADILTRDLDGAGPLRTVTGPLPFKNWPGGANRRVADDLGRRTGAGLIVYGSVARLGADTVALRTTVLDRAGNTTADFEVRGSESRIGMLSDSLVFGILKLLGRERPIASATRVSLGSRSLPALKEFLRGEQYYRRGMWDSALTNYERAVAQDSTFALALRRLAYVSASGASSSDEAMNFSRLIPRAVALNRGLAPRDSLLLLADSFRTSAPPRDAASLFFNAARALALLEDAARRYPLDTDIWFELAEASHHTPQPVRPATERILEAIDRAIGLDPGFGPAYEHAVELALQLGDQPRAARYARMGAMLAPNTEASAFQLSQLIFDSGVGSPATTLALRQASASALLGTGAEHLRWATDSGEAALVLLRLVAEGKAPQSGADVFVSDPLFRPRHLAWALAFRGHLEAAADVLPARQPVSRALAATLNPFLELALFGAVPDSTARRVFAGAFAPDAQWGGTPGRVLPHYLKGAPWWLARGDTVALARLAERAADVALDSVGVVASRGRYLHGAALAYLALAQGDSLRAIRLLRALPDTLCMVVFCFHEKVTLARLLAARADYSEAAGLLDRWGQSGGNTPSAVLAALDRARIAEQLADTVVALGRYRFVAEAWRHADPVLQPYVTEASGALTRLRPDKKRP
jgi:serine/threonine-protein kinase